MFHAWALAACYSTLTNIKQQDRTASLSSARSTRLSMGRTHLPSLRRRTRHAARSRSEVAMRIKAIESTDLFVGSAHRPDRAYQVVRVTVSGAGASGAGGPSGMDDLSGAGGPIRVRVEGPAVTTPEPE